MTNLPKNESPEPVESGWEKEFDRRFIRDEQGHVYETLLGGEIKSFISNLLESTKREARGEGRREIIHLIEIAVPLLTKQNHENTFTTH